MRQVRLISRKGWMPTSRVLSTEKDVFISRCSGTLARGPDGSSCRSFESAKMRLGYRSLTGMSTYRLRCDPREPPPLARPHVRVGRPEAVRSPLQGDPILRTKPVSELQAAGLRDVRPHRAGNGTRRAPAKGGVSAAGRRRPRNERRRPLPAPHSQLTIQNPQRPHAEHPRRWQLTRMKIWSDLHGDMQSQAEMPWPPARRAGGNNNVGPYPMQP